MKLDSEQVICHGTIGHKANSKPFEYDNNGADFIGLKSENGAVKDNHDGVLKGWEGNANSLQYKINCEDRPSPTVSKLDSAKKMGEKEVQDLGTILSPAHSPLKMEAFEDSVFYMDKSVMERELPELMVCYEENTYHVVKDICIDEGVPSKGKFWFDTGVDEKNSSTLLPHENDINSEMVKGKINTPVQNVLQSSTEKEEQDLHMPLPEPMKFLEEKHTKNDLSLECVSEGLMPSGDANDDASKKIINQASEEALSLGDLFAMPDVSKEPSPVSSQNNIDEVEQQSLQSQSEFEIPSSAGKEFANMNNSVIMEAPPSVSGGQECGHEEAVLQSTDLDSAAQKSENSSEKAVFVCPALTTLEESENGRKAELASHSLDSVSVPEESANGNADELSHNRDVQTGNITSDFDSPAAAISEKRDCSQNGNSEHLDVRESSRLNTTNAEAVLSQLQYGHGESSFSAAVPISGLISYSGPITYSGSLSLRSDSSTTSTRSFAFPVLQSEWNSSPVRMAKADRRNFRRNRSWRQGLLCCRF